MIPDEGKGKKNIQRRNSKPGRRSKKKNKKVLAQSMTEKTWEISLY